MFPQGKTVLVAALTLGALAHCAPEAGTSSSAPGSGDWEYVVVGSGAGGGTVAARLARAGKRVLLLEAGEDVGERPTYRVPAMHALATEDPELAWWFFVRHHADRALDAEDSKHTEAGILYPRGSALGGSTAVNAMVTVLPSPSDWNRLAELADEPAFRARAMAPYYARVREWLGIELPSPSLVADDPKAAAMIGAAVAEAGDPSAPIAQASELAKVLSNDVNQALAGGEASGVFRLPLATREGVRNGTRELLLRTVAEGYPLTIQTGSFVTGLVWDESRDHPVVKGVELVRRSHVYGASLQKVAPPRERETVLASREIILSAGTFNSPQILMLSGIGDRRELAAHGIVTRAERRGVGKNLQDRYEAGIVTELGTPLDVVLRCRLGRPAADDPCLRDWQNGEGVYRTPGFLAGIFTRGAPEAPLTDLAIFAVPSDARGYYPGYSAVAAAAKNRFSWLLLNAHNRNRDGRVSLASNGPFERPIIELSSFDEKAPLADPDLRVMVTGIKTVRGILDRARALLPNETIDEIWPGPGVQTDEALAAFVRKEAWGHHACGTDKLGRANDPDAVVDARFRVIGVERLRIVDASVFPEIPGTFIALPLYMLAERAADFILEGAR